MPKKEVKKEKEKAAPEILRTPKGMHDILPSEMPWWDRVSGVTRRARDFYNFSGIETPILEYAELFNKGVGEDTDIVGKEMYTFKSKGGDMLAMRPEGTTPVMRAYLEHSLSRQSPLQKLYYEGPMFRYENPQAGRFRQHHQVGFEIIGGQNDPLYDAQVILIFQRILEDLKIRNVGLKINSIGCRVCRPLYKKQLQAYYKRHLKDMCEDCNRRFATNPLRLLDCKNEKCQPFKENAPSFFDRLCVTCSAHLKTILEYLDEIQISYMLDNSLVRGLDYYSRTVFEYFVEGEGAEAGAVAGGGRYDYLAEQLGARPIPGVGGAAGVERLIFVMKSQGATLPEKKERKVFMIHVGELAKKKSLRIIEELRRSGIHVIENLSKESLKAQLKAADREEVPMALILGQKEIFEESVILRDLKSSLQETIPLSRLLEEVKKRLK
jgi:histidyl-tRNA synthetase